MDSTEVKGRVQLVGSELILSSLSCLVTSRGPLVKPLTSLAAFRPQGLLRALPDASVRVQREQHRQRLIRVQVPIPQQQQQVAADVQQSPAVADRLATAAHPQPGHQPGQLRGEDAVRREAGEGRRHPAQC